MLFDGDPGPTPPQGLVTIARFESPVQAQIARGMLYSAGIECSLVGENVNNLLQAAFRVRPQVRLEDEIAVRDLMGQADSNEPAEGLGDS